MRFLCLISLFLCTLVLSGCDDTVSHYYPSKSVADTEGLFQRGWLPFIIPDSTRDITTINDLDTNESAGDFSFFPLDAEGFKKHLHKILPSEITGTDGTRYLKQGYSAYQYSDKDTVWLFFIHAINGHCEYRMRANIP